MSVMRFWYRVLSIGLQTLDPGLICVYVRAEQARGMHVRAEQARGMYARAEQARGMYVKA